MESFAQLSGDCNPIHLDPEYAKTSRFGRCIVYGVLTSSVAITAMQKLLGDGTILLSVNTSYKAPLYVDEKFEAVAEVSEIKKGRVIASVVCRSLDTDKVLVEGEMSAMKPRGT